MQQTSFSSMAMILVTAMVLYSCSAARILGTYNEGGNICGAVQRAVKRNEAPSECKCPGGKHQVFCVDTNEVASESRKFKPATVFDICGGAGAYCAKKPRGIPKSLESEESEFSYWVDEFDKIEKSVNSLVTPQEAPTAPPVPTTTTTTLDLAMWVDAAELFKVADSNFKCCEHSGGAEAPRIQNVKEGGLPKKRSICTDLKGCGCMFGDKWHNTLNVAKKASGKCRVRLGYLAIKLNVPPEDLLYLHSE